MKGKYESLADRTYVQIKKDIFSGKLPQGTRISELKLAEIYHVSRTPIREAVRKLSEQGLVKCHPRSHMEVVVHGYRSQEQLLELHVYLMKFAIRKYSAEEITALGEKLLTAARKAEKATQAADILKYTTSIYHRLMEEASHEMLSSIYSKNIEPAFMLLLGQIRDDEERLAGYTAAVSSFVQALACADIDAAEQKLAAAAELLRI